MKTHIEGFEWDVCTKSKEVSVVVNSFEECEELLRRKYVLKEIYAIGGKDLLLKVFKDMGIHSMGRYLLIKWVEKDFPMVMEVKQTINGWFIPWIPNPLLSGPIACSIEQAWRFKEAYEYLDIRLKFIPMESQEYVWQ